jgi:hypothetical protein
MLCDMSFVVVMCICLCMLFVVPYCITAATGLTTNLQPNNNNKNSNNNNDDECRLF